MRVSVESSDSIMETVGQGAQVGQAAERLEGLVSRRRFEGLEDRMRVKKQIQRHKGVGGPER